MRKSMLFFLIWCGCRSLSPHPLTNSVDAGARIFARGCPECHDPGDGTLSGQSRAVPGTTEFAPNLTPDPITGLGDWNESDIARTLRQGVDKNGDPLCPSMPTYADMTPSELSAIAHYLLALEPVQRDDIPQSICPPIKGTAPLSNPSESIVDAGRPDLAPPDLLIAATGPCHPVINEVQTGGVLSAADEFIEIYNGCAQPFELTGSSLVYYSAHGTKSLLFSLNGLVLGPGRRRVAGSERFSGVPDLRFSADLADSGGAVALLDAQGQSIDGVGWGSADAMLVESQAALRPPKCQSIARLPDGVDHDDNSVDFAVTTPTPGASNH